MTSSSLELDGFLLSDVPFVIGLGAAEGEVEYKVDSRCRNLMLLDSTLPASANGGCGGDFGGLLLGGEEVVSRT